MGEVAKKRKSVVRGKVRRADELNELPPGPDVGPKFLWWRGQWWRVAEVFNEMESGEGHSLHPCPGKKTIRLEAIDEKPG